MNPGSHLTGREERRLPIMMEVKLAHANGGQPERTITDNISPHGVRVRSTCQWRLGEQAEIIPTKEGMPMQGEVVYCQKVEDGGFFVGLKFGTAASLGPSWSGLTACSSRICFARCDGKPRARRRRGSGWLVR